MKRNINREEVMEDEIIHSNGSTVFAGSKAVNVFACMAVAHALKLYARTGIKANRAYTPKNMLAFVEVETGKKFKRTQMMEAAEYLIAFAQSQRVTIPERSE